MAITFVAGNEPSAWQLSGNFEHTGIAAARSEGVAIIKRCNDSLTFDLSQVSSSDSSGVALLIDWLRVAEQANVSVRYVNTPASMQDIIRVSGLDGILL